MHFVAWNGEIWSSPFQPNELVLDGPSGLRTREGCAVAWDADGYRGENWIALREWTEERAKAIAAIPRRTGNQARSERLCGDAYCSSSFGYGKQPYGASDKPIVIFQW